MSKEVSTLASRLVYFSIINSPAAKSLASHLVKSADDSIILPFTDHPGPITEAILSRPFKSLTVCERDPALRESFAVSQPLWCYLSMARSARCTIEPLWTNLHSLTSEHDRNMSNKYILIRTYKSIRTTCLISLSRPTVIRLRRDARKLLRKVSVLVKAKSVINT